MKDGNKQDEGNKKPEKKTQLELPVVEEKPRHERTTIPYGLPPVGDEEVTPLLDRLPLPLLKHRCRQGG